MSFNEEVASRLEQIAELLELNQANQFRINANQRAARVIGDHPSDLEPIAEDQKELTKIDGIGKGIAEKIAEYKRTGEIQELKDLQSQVPAGLTDLIRIPALGPKTARALWQEIGVTDIDGLKAAIESGEIYNVPRMGEKAVEKIRANIEFANESGQRTHRGVALPLADRLVERIGGIKGVTRCACAGSLRRGKETVGDIDILVVTSDPDAAHKALKEADEVERVIASGESKTSVRVTITDVPGSWKGHAPDERPSIQVDLRSIPPESWGAALMYFTGSKEHNVRLRERALARGYTLNEYGLFPEATKADKPPQQRGVKPKAGGEEEEVYAALDLPWIPPELREDRAELELKETPRLIETDDIRAELHAHTTDSDGKLQLEELVRRARDRGFHTIAVTDHSKASAQAGGLDADRLAQQREKIEAFRQSQKKGDIAVLCGCEVDILADGSLDFDDDVLASLDFVVASPHTALDQSPKKASQRLISAIENPYVHVIGHATGRIIDRRPGLRPAMDEVIAAAKEHDVALEINSHWLRLDIADAHVRAAIDAGCLIAIDCDVHYPGDFDNIVHGVATARRGWVTPDRCLNAWDKKRLATWIESKRT